MSAMRTGFVFSMMVTAGLMLSGCHFFKDVEAEKQLPKEEAKAEIKLDPVHFSDLPIPPKVKGFYSLKPHASP